MYIETAGTLVWASIRLGGSRPAVITTAPETR
jgi:hypothetical protein